MKHKRYRTMNSETMRTIVTVVLILITQAVTAYDIKINGLCYNIIHDNAYVVYGDKKANSHGLVYDSPNERNFNGTLEIPAKISYKGVQYNVVGIQDGAFKGCVYLKNVIISEGVKNIGDEAFALCECMETIDIPNSVDYISSSAFYGCWAIKTATIPERLVTEELFNDKVRERMGSKKVDIIKKASNNSIMFTNSSSIYDYRPYRIMAEMPLSQAAVKKNPLPNTSQLPESTLMKEDANTQKIANTALTNGTDNSYKTTIRRPAQKRIALVIGNANYGPKSHLEKLNSPEKDAKDIYSKLKELDFEMISNAPIINAGKKHMDLVIGDFARKSKDYDVALLYYSGHGIQGDSGYDATNYLIPTNAELDYRENMSGQCVDLNKIINILNERGKDKATIVLIDACRTVLHLPSRYDSYRTKGGGNELKGLNVPRYKVKDSSLTQRPRGVCIVYATSAGDIAIDGQENANSFFTQGLLECLDEDKNEALPNFIQLLQEKVEHISDSRQSPALYNGMKGRFYFNPNK